MSDTSAPALLDPAAFATRIDGRATGLFELRNDAGMVVSLTNLGAKILQIIVPDRHGRPGDVALGYDNMQALLQGAPSMGAFIGRYAGRIGNARFALGGSEYRLSANAGPHCLHGGQIGSRHRVFDVHQISRDAIELYLRFKHGEQGFPGELALRLSYRLGEDNELIIEHEASGGALAAPASFASHVFFNLDFPHSRTIDGHRLQIPSTEVLCTDADGIATGERIDVSGALDLRGGRLLGASADHGSNFAPLVCDHAFLPSGTPGTERLCAQLDCAASGRSMQVWSTEPVLQVYTADMLGRGDQPDYGKQGVLHAPRMAVCIEPQQFPNAPNVPQFPLNLVSADKPYRARTRYRFGLLDS